MPVPDAAHPLFALDPKDFVTARDPLAKRLQKEGDKDGAKAVKALRRPTIPIWALNQVARERPDEIEALVAASSKAHAAQDKDVRDALARRRDRMHEVLVLARQMIDGSGRQADQHELDITSALSTILASDGLTRDLLDGVLTQVSDEAADIEWPDVAGAPVPRGPTREQIRARRARPSSSRGGRCGDACGRRGASPERGSRGARACRSRGGASGGVSADRGRTRGWRHVDRSRHRTAAGRHPTQVEPAREAQRHELGVDRGTARGTRRRREGSALPGGRADGRGARVLCRSRPFRLRNRARRRGARHRACGLRDADPHRHLDPASAVATGTRHRRGERTRGGRRPGARARQRHPHRRGIGAVQRGVRSHRTVRLRHRSQLAAAPFDRRQPRLGADADRPHHRCARSGSHRTGHPRRARRRAARCRARDGRTRCRQQSMGRAHDEGGRMEPARDRQPASRHRHGEPHADSLVVHR